MKKQYCSFAMGVVFMALMAPTIWAQNPSMTIQHSGLTPNDTLWVLPGDSIDFIYGGGGNHPMTSGHGGTASPVFFPTVTVTSAQPMATFALTTIGTYLFHCGTNPSNQANWGTIIVQQANAVTPQVAGNQLLVYPNPCNGMLHIGGKLPLEASYGILDMDGKLLLHGSLPADMVSLDVSELPAGMYVVKIDWNGGSLARVFSKR